MPAPRPAYPVSDHCDGRIFFNPGDFRLPTWREILRWQRTRRATPWPKWVEIAPANLPALAPEGPEIAATWINHASFLLRLPRLNLLIDPVYSRCCGPFGRLGPRRVHAPGLPFAALPKVDVLLLSHDHYDHCDLPTLRAVARRDNPLAVTPLGNGDLLRRAGLPRVVELDWWESHDLPGGNRVTLTPSQHWSNRLTGPRCGRLWGGFHLQTEARRVQFVGDTGYHPHWFKEIRTRLGAPDLSLIPIGAYEPRWFMKPQHCNPAEALQIHRDLASRKSIGMHWGTFQLTDEGRLAPVEALRESLAAGPQGEADFITLEPGGSVVV